MLPKAGEAAANKLNNQIEQDHHFIKRLVNQQALARSTQRDGQVLA